VFPNWFCVFSLHLVLYIFTFRFGDYTSRDLKNAVENNLIVKNGDKKTTKYRKP